MNKHKYVILVISLFFLSYLMISNIRTTRANNQLWQARFEKFLCDVQENSIRNYDWKKNDWDNYFHNQLKQLPIKNKEQFNKAVTNSLKNLQDNHSYLIIKTECSEQIQKTKSEPVITAQDGIGLINLPTLIIENINEQEELLSDKWVVDFQKKLDSITKKVTKGWIIDLTENEGGNLFPMIAALSRFYNTQNIGGYYFYGPENIKEKQILTFDGQSFASNGEKYLSYKTAFPVNKNNLPVVVLTGNKTSSSAEFLALALQRQKNLTLIGEPSYGIATVNAAMELPDKLGYYMLTIGYYLDKENKPLLSKKVVPEIIIKENKPGLIKKAKKIIYEKY